MKLARELFQRSRAFIEIREITNDGKNNKALFFKPEQIKAYIPPNNKNVYMGVYDRKKGNGKASGCISTGALWADYDAMGIDEVVGLLDKAGLPEPSIIVNSGHGIHTYWLLVERTTKGVTSLLRAIAERTGADAGATDRARVMRLPNTMNVKGDPVPCKEIGGNYRRYPIGLFEDLLGVKATEPIVEKRISLNIQADRPCIGGILKGVPEGERNFALGRLTKWLQIKGYTKDKATKTILQWNRLNDPPENEGKLMKDFNAYWYGDYKLLGCRINKPELQQLLNKYCRRPECSFTGSIDHIKLDNAVKYNNRLLNDLSSLTGNDLIIYGLLVRHKEGLTTSLLVDKLTSKDKPCMNKETRINCIKTLKAKGFIEVIKGNRRAGRENLHKAIPQGTYGTGYTLITNGAINGAIDGRITPAAFRLYVLLLKYAYRKGYCFPSTFTLGKELGINRSVISRQLQILDKKDYIKRDYTLSNGAEKLVITLLV